MAEQHTENSPILPARKAPLARVAACAALALGAFVLLLLNGRSIVTLDSLPYRYLPTALLRHHTFRLDAFPELADKTNYSIVRDRDGHLISKKPALPGFVVLPPYLAYLAVKGHIPVLPTHLMLLGKLGASATAALAVAALALLLGSIGLRRRWIAPAAALGLVALTPFWFTAMDCWPHPLLALLNTLSLLILLARRQHPWTWGLIGLCQGLALAARLGAVAVTLVFAASALLLHAPSLRERLKRLGLLAAGTLPPLLLLAWYNAHYFGGPFSQGFGSQAADRIQSPWIGLAGFLISPAKGIFVFSPIMILACWAFGGGFWRRLDVRLCASAIALHMVYWACYADWLGGWCYGPRYLADVMPFGVLLAALGLDRLLADSRRPLRVRAAVALLAAVSLLFQAAGFFGWDADYYRLYDRGFRGARQLWVFKAPPEPLWLLERRVWYRPTHIP